MNKKILAIATALSIAMGLGAFAASQAPITPTNRVEAVQYCQVCEWVWSYKAQAWVRSCHLVVCHAV